ncbi:DUF302 domain-containing protein [Pseudooceanicola aestuarii]|uniref:DUF302 domain-containing protein n=1 Tax=Pseudooceanicola aestuarii TaxID=2697319 RepID=UPI0013D49290|nr:DUF302 domain-containing protein [Pseudooceanicola aestuarii]
MSHPIFKPVLAATALVLTLVTPALADFERHRADGSVSAVMDRLQSLVEEKGATVFARVDHGQGARDAGFDLAPAELLIFGNPRLGSPVMQEDALAGLVLPLRMLAFEDDEGQVWIAYEEVEEMVDDLDVDDDLEQLEKMEDALENFARGAASSG